LIDQSNAAQPFAARQNFSGADMGKVLLSLGAVALVSSAAYLFAGGDKCTGTATAGSCSDKGSLVSTGGTCAEKTSTVSTGGTCAEKTTLTSTGGDQCAEKTTAVKADSKGACCDASKATSLVMAKDAKSIDAIKTLAGKWEGKTEHGPAQVEYKVSSNGSVVVETMFPGTQHEMTNVYAMDGDRLIMTHYCAAGSQPRMAMTKQEGNTYTFEMFDATNLPDKNAMYMNGLELTIEGDKIVQNWSAMDGGKPAEHAKFELTRTKTASAQN
jgi:hypothetical protein